MGWANQPGCGRSGAMIPWLGAHYWQILLAIGYALTWLAIPHVLFSKKRPVSTLCWIWAIILFPYLGVLAYFLLGAEKIKTARFRKRGKFQRESTAEAPTLPDDPAEESLLRTLSAITERPHTSATSLELLVNAAAFYPRLLSEIEGARHHVHVLFYIWRKDEYGSRFLDALVAAATRGVKVRLLVDRIGALEVPGRFFKPLEEAGGEFAWFSSLDLLRNRFFFHLRNHRKVQIVDGRVGFVGGMNIGREYDGKDEKIGRWRDAQLVVEGPVVAQMQEVFAQDWFFATGERLVHPTYYPTAEGEPVATGQLIAGGPDLDREPMYKTWLTLLHGARERIWLSAGYFTPDVALLGAMQIAALRGVDVRLLTSAASEQPYLVRVGRSYYEELLDCGVRIYEFQGGVHHAKVMALDGRSAMVGSANFDIRSMRLNFELNLLMTCPALAQEVENMLEADFEDSREIRLSEFRKRPFRQKLAEACLRPLSPLL